MNPYSSALGQWTLHTRFATDASRVTPILAGEHGHVTRRRNDDTIPKTRTPAARPRRAENTGGNCAKAVPDMPIVL